MTCYNNGVSRITTRIAMPDNDYAADLERWVRNQRPQSLLIVGRANHPLRECLAAATAADVTHIDAGDHTSLGTHTFDVAVVLCALESLERREASALLAHLRDVVARRTMVLTRMGEQWRDNVSHWQRNDFLSYGFHLFGRYTEGGFPVHLYRFDLYDYKPTPEWLNARHWANPELWGKYRW